MRFWPRKREHGWWTGPGMAKHHCKPPPMPEGVPAGIIFRCECSTEWAWTPAP
jgi:hypothetical protein